MTVFDRRIDRIIEIDAMFVSTMARGSWMIAASKEREALVRQLNAEGHNIEHKYQPRCEDGSRTD